MRRLQLLVLRCHLELLALLLPDVSKLFPLRYLLRSFTPHRPSWVYRGLSESDIVALVHRRCSQPWRMRGRRCLREGLLCYYFLRLAGVPAVLRFGVYTETRGRELAHCWVDVAERHVTSPPQSTYVLLLSHAG